MLWIRSSGSRPRWDSGDGQASGHLTDEHIARHNLLATTLPCPLSLPPNGSCIGKSPRVKDCDASHAGGSGDGKPSDSLSYERAFDESEYRKQLQALHRRANDRYRQVPHALEQTFAGASGARISISPTNQWPSVPICCLSGPVLLSLLSLPSPLTKSLLICLP